MQVNYIQVIDNQLTLTLFSLVLKEKSGGPLCLLERRAKWKIN